MNFLFFNYVKHLNYSGSVVFPLEVFSVSILESVYKLQFSGMSQQMIGVTMI